MPAERTTGSVAATVIASRSPGRASCPAAIHVQSPRATGQPEPKLSRHPSVRSARATGAVAVTVGTGERRSIGGTSLGCGISSSGRGWRADGKCQPSRTVLARRTSPGFRAEGLEGFSASAVRPRTTLPERRPGPSLRRHDAQASAPTPPQPPALTAPGRWVHIRRASAPAPA